MTYRRRPRYDKLIKACYRITYHFIERLFRYGRIFFGQDQKKRLDELIRQGKSRANTVLKMSERLDTYLSATQLGITASSLLLGWFGGPLLAEAFREILGVSSGSWYDHSLVFACAFLIIVFLHVVFGELVPRTIALGKVEQVAMAVAYPLVFFHYLLYPLVVFF